MLAELRRLTEGVLEDIAGEDVMSAKVYESFKAHLAKARRWTEISETVMLQQRMAQG